MKKNRRRLTAFMLALILALSMIPITAIAEGVSSMPSEGNETEEVKDATTPSEQSGSESENENSTLPDRLSVPAEPTLETPPQSAVPSEAPSAAIRTPRGPATTTGSITVNCYLINDQGENIGHDGLSLADQSQKTVFKSYLYEHNGNTAIPLDENAAAGITIDPISYIDETYQFEGEKSETNLYYPVQLTVGKPNVEIWLAYTAEHKLTVKANMPGDASYSVQYDKKLKVGNEYTIKNLFDPDAKLLNLPAGYLLLGWAYTQEKADTRQDFDFLPDAKIFISDEEANITLYAVIKKQTTATIKIVPYLINPLTNTPADSNGNPIINKEDIITFEDQAFYFEQNGSKDLEIGKTYDVRNWNYNFTISGVHVPGFSQPRTLRINYLQNGVESPLFYEQNHLLTEDTVMYWPFASDHYNTFHTNIPGQSDETFDAFDGYAGLFPHRPFAGNGKSVINQVYLTSTAGNRSYPNAEAAMKRLGYGREVTNASGSYALIGWSTNPASSGNNVPGTPGYDENFWSAETKLIPQDAIDMDIYAIWQSSSVSGIEIFPVAYLVNSQGKPVDEAGQEIAFDNINDPGEFARKIVRLPNTVVVKALNGENTSNTVFWLDMIQRVTAPLSAIDSQTRISYSYEIRSGNPENGGTTNNSLILVKADGAYVPESGEKKTIYFGYKAPASLVWDTNYPAESGLTNEQIVLKNVQAGLHLQNYNAGFSWAGAKFSTSTPNVPGYVFAGWSTSKDATQVEYPVYEGYYTPDPRVKDGQTTFYAMWVKEEQTVAINYIPILGYYATPLNEQGEILDSSNFAADKVVLGDPILTQRKLPIGSSYAIDFAQKGGDSGNPNYIPSYTTTEGKVYVPTIDNLGISTLYDETGQMLSKTGNGDIVNNASYVKPSAGSVYNVYVLFSSTSTVTVDANYPADAAISPDTQRSGSVTDSIGRDLWRVAHFPWLNVNVPGYKFLGFSKAQDDIADIFGVDSILIPNYDVYLYAQWQKVSTDPEKGTIMVVSYETNAQGEALDADGNVVADYKDAYKIKTHQYQNGEEYELELGARYYAYARNFTIGNDRFLYVPASHVASGGHLGDSNCPGERLTQSNKDPILYYGYERRIPYKLSYDPNLPSDINGNPGEPLYRNEMFAGGEEILDELAVFARNDFPGNPNPSYGFIGWSTTPNWTVGQPLYTQAGTTPFVMPHANTTLYAVWLPSYQYNRVTFMPGDQGVLSGADGSGNVAHRLLAGSRLGDVVAPPQVNPRARYLFVGWEPVYNANTILKSDLVFVAQYRYIPLPINPPITPTPLPPGTITPTPDSPPTQPTTTPTITPKQTPTPSKSDPKGTSIEEEAPPLSEGEVNPAWALLNLILTLLGGILSIAFVLMYVHKRRQEESDEDADERRLRVVSAQAHGDEHKEDPEALKKRLAWRLFMVILTIVAILLFIFTEDMSLPMVFVDWWTILHVIIFVVQILFAIISTRKKKIEKEDSEAELETARQRFVASVTNS